MADATGRAAKKRSKDKKNVPHLDRMNRTYPVIKTVVLRGADMVRLGNIVVAE